MNIFQMMAKVYREKLFILFRTHIRKWYHLDISQHGEESYMAKTAFQAHIEFNLFGKIDRLGICLKALIEVTNITAQKTFNVK